MNKKDISLLAKEGWTVECESPCEIHHKDTNSVATGIAAQIILDKILKINHYCQKSFKNYSEQELIVPDISKNTANALKLIKYMIWYPTLPVIPMVDYEVCCDDEHSYWAGSIGEIRKDVFYMPDTTILSSIEEIEEHFEMEVDIRNPYNDFSREEMNKLIEEEIKKSDIKEAIYIYIEMPKVV